MKILLTGKNGQLGTAFKKELIKREISYKAVGHTEQKDVPAGTYDEISVPTSTKLPVELSFMAIKKNLTGLYHAVNSGYCSRADWAREILRIKNLNKVIDELSWNWQYLSDSLDESNEEYKKDHEKFQKTFLNAE